MKLWLDDLCEDPEVPERHPPSGWVGVKTYEEAIPYVKSGIVTHISFDHDLGVDSDGNVLKSGYDLALLIEEEAYFKNIPMICMSVHSANPVGRQNIEKAIQNAYRYWSPYR